MKVILLERVEGWGGLGDVVNVKDGYARNFLLPRQKALRANEANMKVFEAQRTEIEARNAKARESAAKAGEKLDGTSYVLIRQAGESGQLYGSVAARDVIDAANAEGAKIERSMVVLDKPIKTLGVHEVKVRLHAEVTVTVNINIITANGDAEKISGAKKTLTFAIIGFVFIMLSLVIFNFVFKITGTPQNSVGIGDDGGVVITPAP